MIVSSRLVELQKRFAKEAAACRSNAARVIGEREVQRTAVNQMERQFGSTMMKRREVRLINRLDVPFDIEMRRDLFMFIIREVLVHRKMVVGTAERSISLE